MGRLFAAVAASAAACVAVLASAVPLLPGADLLPRGFDVLSEVGLGPLDGLRGWRPPHVVADLPGPSVFTVGGKEYSVMGGAAVVPLAEESCPASPSVFVLRTIEEYQVRVPPRPSRVSRQ